MKRLLLVIAILFFLTVPSISTSFSYASTEQIIINVSYTYLYKTADLDNHYDFKIYSNEKLNLVDSQPNYYEVTYTFEDTNYYGYIKKEFASTYQPDQEIILVYNGKIINQTEVFDITTNSSLNITLDKNHEIYIYEAYDSDKEFTNIKFEYDNQIYVGKVATANISPNGVNKTFIIAISIISAVVGVVLILLGFKTKNKWMKWFKKRK